MGGVDEGRSGAMFAMMIQWATLVVTAVVDLGGRAGW
jgi:hypothetical protein